MVNRSQVRIVAAVAVTLGVATLGGLAPRLALAGEVDDFAAALKESTGEYTATYVLTKLHTFKVGKKCWAKLPDKEGGAIHAAGFATRDVAAYAKRVSGDDWSAIETQNNSDREANKVLIEPMIEAFKSKFMFNISVDGDDCDGKSSAMWIRYWSTLATAVRNFPPPSGKAIINLNVSSKARDVLVDVSKDGTTFTITGAKDIEPKAWSDKLERPFKQLDAGIPDDFAYVTKEATGHYYTAWVLTKLHTFKVGKKCRAKLSDKEAGAVHAATFATRDVYEYAKASGAEDWDAIESQTANEPKFNRDLVEKDMEKFKSRFSITINVEGDDCDVQQNSLWLRYWTTIATALRNYPPKGKKVAIVLNVTSKAKDVTANGLTFTAPRDKEAPAWSDKLEAPFRKAAGKK